MNKFITFEGPDGSGKSTQIQMLGDHLQRQGHQVHITREPGGCAISEQIRQILHNTDNAAMVPMTEILLYSASRAQLVYQVIKPHLAIGEIVLCDRYVDSTYAYQGYGRGLGLGMLEAITGFVTEGLQPDLTICLDLPVEIGLARKLDEGVFNRMDREGAIFHDRVRQGYLTMARAYSRRWALVDASRPIDAVHHTIKQIYKERFHD